MRILMIGASLGFDTMYMMPAVAKANGVEDFTFGILYHSAAAAYHAGWLERNAVAYAYYEFCSDKDLVWRRADKEGNFHPHIPSSGNDKYIDDGSIAVTPEFGLKRADWDVVILMASSAEITGRICANPRQNLNMESVDSMMDSVKKLLGRTPKFAWHMIWALPQDDSLLNDVRRKYLAEYYDGDAMKMYEANVAHSKAVVIPHLQDKVDYVFPCATAIQNAKSSAFVEDKDIHRDFIHGTDYGRLIAAYTWFCGLTGINIGDCKFAPVYFGILRDNDRRLAQQDWVLTDLQEKVLVESVENAYKNPFELTVSQYQ